MAFPPTLNVRPATSVLPPQVEVFFPAFEVGTVRVTVTRTVGDRSAEVRGAVRVGTAGSLSRIDRELAFGVPMSYRAEMFDADGDSLGFTDIASVTVFERRSFMFNPLFPDGAVAVEFAPSAADSIERPTPHEVSYPMGRRVGVILSQPRLGVVGVRLDVVTASLADADRVSALVGGYTGSVPPVVCVLLGDDVRMRLPRPFYAGIRSLVEQQVSYRFGGEEINHLITADEVSPPVPSLFIPLLTNADIDVSFETNADIDAGNTSNGELNRRYDLAGAASA